MAEKKQKIIGQILVERGVVTEAKLAQALEMQRQKPDVRIGEVLVRMGAATWNQICEALGELLGYPFVDLRKIEIHPQVIHAVPKAMARKHNLVPLGEEGGVLTVAIANPFDLSAVDNMRFYFNREVRIVIAAPDALEEAIHCYYGDEAPAAVAAPAPAKVYPPEAAPKATRAPKSEPMADVRQVAQTAENIFLSLLNERGVFAASFQTAGFDGIVFDTRNEYFRAGHCPFYVRIKCRGSKSEEYAAQDQPQDAFDDLGAAARRLEISETSLYGIIGFFKNNDIRSIMYFGIPLASIKSFLASGKYHFSVRQCQAVMEHNQNIFTL